MNIKLQDLITEVKIIPPNELRATENPDRKSWEINFPFGDVRVYLSHSHSLMFFTPKAPLENYKKIIKYLKSNKIKYKIYQGVQVAIPYDELKIVQAKVEEVRISTPNKLSPYEQTASQFYFKDIDDKEHGWQSFYYNGYYLNPTGSHTLSINFLGEDKWEVSCRKFLNKRKIPYNILPDGSISFEEKYVDFTGFQKHIEDVN